MTSSLCDRPDLPPFHRDICSGKYCADRGYPPEKCAEIAAEMNRGHEAFLTKNPTAIPQRRTCLFLGEAIRDPETGRAKTKECPSCGGLLAKQVVHACSCPSHASTPDTIAAECSRCPDHCPSPPPSVFTPLPDDPPVAVVIGTYFWPALVELQIRTIRHTCGDVPILVSDDCSPDGKADRIRALAGRYPGVDVVVSETNVGHAGGDLGAFSRGLPWASAKGIPYLVKLSHRFLVTVPRWAQDGARLLRQTGKAVLAQGWALPIRTECMMMDVAKCLQEPFLDMIECKARNTPAELIVHAGLQHYCGNSFEPWPLLLGGDRQVHKDGILWHDADPVQAYHALAAKMGVALDADFNCAGSHFLPGYKGG